MSRITVIIPTHRRPKLLPRAIKSAFSAGVDVEVVVVDDASIDETADVCRSLSNINYVRLDHNQGVAAARNAGVANGTSEFISFLDDDDVRLPGSLDLQLRAISAKPEVAMIYGQAWIDDLEDSSSREFYPKHCLHGDLFWDLLIENFIPCGSALIRRSAFLEVGLLDDTIPGIDDWDLWIRVAEGSQIAALKQPVMTWRKSTLKSGQGTSRADNLVRMSVRQMHNRWLKLDRSVRAPEQKRREVFEAFSSKMARHLGLETLRAIKTGNFVNAQRTSATAMRFYPWRSVRGAIRFPPQYLFRRLRLNQLVS